MARDSYRQYNMGFQFCCTEFQFHFLGAIANMYASGCFEEPIPTRDNMLRKKQSEDNDINMFLQVMEQNPYIWL